MNPLETVAKAMIKLLEHPRAAQRQAIVISLARMGLYSPPLEGLPEMEADLLIAAMENELRTGRFPITSVEDCINALEEAIKEHKTGIPARFPEGTQDTRP